MAALRRQRRPSIRQIGQVEIHDDVGVIVIAGWALGPCLRNCSCHRHPATGQLMVNNDDEFGMLGLYRFRDCDCCGPWTAEELLAIVHLAAELAELEVSS